MTIKQFADKYNVEKRNVDYWTTIGLIRYAQHEQNGRREYTSDSEEDMKLILILKAAGLSAASIMDIKDEFTLENGKNARVTKKKYAQLIHEQIQKSFEEYRKALNWLDEIEG